MLIIKLTVMFPHTWTFGSLKPRLSLLKVYVVFIVFLTYLYEFLLNFLFFSSK